MNSVVLLCQALVIVASLGAISGAIAQSPTQQAAKFYDDAQARYERKEFAAAAVQLKNALQLDKKLLSAHLLLGKTLLAGGELKAAEAALEEALKQGVNRAEVGPYLGQVYLLLGEPKKLLDTVTLTGIPESLQTEILVIRGTAFAMSGNLAAASAAFADARKLSPTAADPLIAESPILLRFGEYEKARVMATKATEMAPKNPMAWYQLGTIQHSVGDRPGALASFDKALSLNPKLVDATVSRASVLISTGKQAEAAKILAQLKVAKVVEPRASFLRATLEAANGNAKAAKEEYAQAVNLIDTMAPGARSGSEPLLLAGALSHRALGNLQKSREYLDTLLARNGKHFAGQVLMASVLMEAKELNRALPLLENLMRLAPNEPQVLYMMGSAYMAKKQYAQASEMFERAAGKTSNNEVLRELAFSQFGSGNSTVGLANLEKAFAANPRDYRAGIELAVYFARQGNGARAVGIAESLVKLDPANTAMLNFLGNIKGRLNDKKGMRATFQLALEKDPKFRPAIMNMSWLDMEEGRLEDARKRLTDHLKDKPNDPDVLFQLGMLEQQAKRPAAALAQWTKADSVQNMDPRPGLAKVDLLLANNQADQAAIAAKTLAGKYPEAVPVFHALARVGMAVGDTAMARQALQDASRFARNDVGAQLVTGRMQLAVNQPDAATSTANKVLQLQADDLGALILLVEAAGRRGDAAGVDAAMKTLNAKHAGKPPVLVTAGHVALSRRQYSQAIASYQVAFQQEPSGPLAIALAQAHLGQKEIDQALEVLQGWARKNPSDLVALRAQAEVQAHAGKGEAARASYNAVLAASPDDPGVLSSFAIMLHRMNDPAALAMAERAMKLAPQNAALAASYGSMLVNKGDLENGVRVLREARLRDPGNGGVRWTLSAALAKAGKKAEAKDELRAALASSTPPQPGHELNKVKSELGL